MQQGTSTAARPHTATTGPDARTRILNFIGGSFHEAASGRTLDDHEPATGHMHATVPDGDARDVEAAVAAAEKAFPAWSALGREGRARIP